jgi:putative chitinase
MPDNSALVNFGPALMRLWPHGDAKIPGLRAAMIEQAPLLFAKYRITTAVEVAVMMGEFTEECGGGLEMEEDLNYRAATLHSQWPSHFTMEQAMEMAHHPEQIANQAYNGRMGNQPGTSDGWDFRGRGFSQTTGRDAYKKLGALMKLDLLTKPELINTTDNCFDAGIIDFVVMCGCLPYAQRDDETNATRHLNGGLIGLPQRRASIALWKKALGA